MCMVSRFSRYLLAALLVFVAQGPAKGQESAPRWLDVEFPRDSPVLPESFSLGSSTSAHVRGPSLALDIHSSIVLRNTGTKNISGLTLRVEAQDLTPNGQGSVTVPSLVLRPGKHSRCTLTWNCCGHLTPQRRAARW